MAIRAWFRSLTVGQRILLVLATLTGIGLTSQLAGGGTGVGAPVGFLLFAFLFIFSRWGQKILWRLRNRLLFTYFLFGVVPVILIIIMLGLAGQVMLGQIAADRLRRELDRKEDAVHTAAEDLAFSTSSSPNAETMRAELFERIRRRIPRLTAIVQVGGQISVLPKGPNPFPDLLDWRGTDFSSAAKIGERYYIAARVRPEATSAEVFAFIPLDTETVDSLSPGMIAVGSVLGDVDDDDIDIQVKNGRVSAKGNRRRNRMNIASSVPLLPPVGWWDRELSWLLQLPVRDKSGDDGNAVFTVASRPSILLMDLFGGLAATIVVILLSVVGVVFLIVEGVSLIWSLRLTRTITRTVHDLYEGTRQVATGNFAHRTPVRSKDQLSELAVSFNGMTERVQKLLVEVKEKEKLKAELEIARQVQTRLFPKSVPLLKTLEMAGVCLPGRIVSGDYYDFISMGPRWTALAVADISGKGISAALLMASLQSSLHAQLQLAGAGMNADANGDPVSIALLMGRLNQQLYENTPPEKYATFFCSVYDDDTGTLLYTNGGHLRPILIREGQASTLDGTGMVVGLLPNIQYVQQTFQLQSGDLLALFSDGVPEAENANEDQFGEERLTSILKTNAHRPLDEIIRLVTDGVGKWVHDPDGQDDTTILLARRL